MTQTVHILATCRKAELLPETLLVFNTIRVGFPNARIIVTYNPMLGEKEVEKACKKADAEFGGAWDYVPHHEWIEKTVAASPHPIVFCDTDMIFYESVEGWEFDHPLAGRFVDAFFDSFTKRHTHSRLHTSLLFVDPEELRDRIEDVERITPDHPFKGQLQLFAPFYYSMRHLDLVRHYFHDTCSLLYHAVGGAKFTEDRKDAYTHLNCGTMLDIIGPWHHGLKEIHDMALGDPESARNLWRQQEKYQEQAKCL